MNFTVTLDLCKMFNLDLVHISAFTIHFHRHEYKTNLLTGIQTRQAMYPTYNGISSCVRVTIVGVEK